VPVHLKYLVEHSEVEKVHRTENDGAVRIQGMGKSKNDTGGKNSLTNIVPQLS